MAVESPSEQELHDLELTISKLLRTGVLIAGLILLLGWLWLWFNNGDMLTSLSTYEPRDFIETVHWAVLTQDRAMLMSMVGLVVLVLLPIVRVFLTGVLFIKQKDFMLAGMAFAVFICLGASFFLGIEL